ncbi:MAG: DUF1559 domain-containing protein [Planctomycetia bacterium]|jgi:hypothetical protein
MANGQKNPLVIGCLIAAAVGFVVFIVFIILAFVLGSTFVSRTHSQAQLAMCRNQQRNLALSLHNYESAHGRFPPACVKGKEGQPLYSWRVLMLPYIERSDLYDAFNREEAWDSAANERFSNMDVEPFQCPAREDNIPGVTDYVLVTGPGTVWDGDRQPRSLKDISHPEQTLLMIEVANSDIHWAEPRDLKIDAIDPSFLDENGNFKCAHPTRGATAVFADGRVEDIPPEQVMEALQKLSQIKQKKWKRE